MTLRRIGAGPHGALYACPECDGRNRTAAVRRGAPRCPVCWSEGYIVERIAELYRAGGVEAVRADTAAIMSSKK